MSSEVQEIGFYHLQQTRLEQALPRLLEKVQGLGLRILLLAGSSERVKSLNELLWTYEQQSWLPHGAREDGFAAEQPIFLTATEENPNGAEVLVCVDGVRPDFYPKFRRVVDMFDGLDDEAVALARERWKLYREAGMKLTYWQQSDGGGWEKRA